MNENAIPREGYPIVTYYGTDIQVLVGDHIEYRIWLFFWRGWQPGRIYYVPGLSPKNDELEFNGLTWASIEGTLGQCGSLVDPATHQLDKGVRFLRRSGDGITTTPNDYYFGDEERPNTLERSAEQVRSTDQP